MAGLEGAGRPAPGVSIVLCSRDRAAQLARALDRLPADGLRRHGAELLLVDSASQDETLALMQRRAAALACETTVVHVSAPGLGRARNAGIARAREARIAAAQVLDRERRGTRPVEGLHDDGHVAREATALREPGPHG